MTIQSRMTYGAYPSYVRVTDPPFSAKGDGIADDTLAIQAAIDLAIDKRIETVVLPTGGVYRTTAPIFLDDPRNLRASMTALPFTAGFTLALVGGDGAPWGGEPYGEAIIRTDFQDNTALWVGPGRGCSVKGIGISGPPSARGYRLGLPDTGIAIAISAYGSGALIERCNTNLLHYGIKTGANALPQLTDNTSIVKCQITAAVGVEFFQVNNFINSIEDCVIDGVTGVRADSWTGVHIRGGNLSANLEGNSFAITGGSATVAQGTPGYTNWSLTYTATVTTPDNNLTWNAYNSFAIVTNQFGVVPFNLVSYNSGTQQITLSILDSWIGAHLAALADDPGVATNIIYYLNTATTLYAAELATSMRGHMITAEHVHIENIGPTTIFRGSALGGGEGTAPNALRDIRYNGDPTAGMTYYLIANGTATEQQKAFYYISRSHPQIMTGNVPLEIVNLAQGEAIDERWIVDSLNPQTPRLHVRGPCPKLQFRIPIYASPLTNGYASQGTCGFGIGEHEDNPFALISTYSTAETWRGPLGAGKVPMAGIRPAPWTTPNITPTQLATLQGTLPAIVTPPAPGIVDVQYPILWGGQTYRTADYNGMAGPPLEFTSNHSFYSYGQDLQIGWHHLGQSCHLYVDDCRLMFPGLGIIIDHGDADPRLYLVTGVYPQLGYVTVLTGVESGSGPWRLHGNLNNTYTGTVLRQQPYALVSAGVQFGTAPDNPTIGQLWYDPATTSLEVWDGSNWRSASSAPAAGVAPSSAIARAAPNSEGDLWFDTTVDTLKFFDGSVWKSVGAGNFLPLTGGALSGNLSVGGMLGVTGSSALAAVNASGNIATTADMSTRDLTVTRNATVNGVMTLSGARQVANTAPADSNLLRWNAAGNSWQPAALQISQRVFTANGTYTRPAGLICAIVECVGGGGGGSGRTQGSGSFVMTACGAGGSGGYSRSVLTGAAIGVSRAVTVGAGAAASGGLTSGGSTSFGGLVVANGAIGPDRTLSGTTASRGGEGALPGTGDFVIPGAPGGNPSMVLTNPQAAPSNFVLMGGVGGSVFGGGGRGGILLIADNYLNDMVGENAQPNSGGGGGGAVGNSGSAVAGGAGGSGICVVTEYTLT